MLILVERHLEDFQPLRVVFVIVLAKREYTLRRVGQSEDMEVEQHNLPLEVGQALHAATVVFQLYIYHTRLYNLALVDGLSMLSGL